MQQVFRDPDNKVVLEGQVVTCNQPYLRGTLDAPGNY